MKKRIPFVFLEYILQEAKKKKFAVLHFNIYSLWWAKTVLETAQKMNSPVIIAVTKHAADNMGGLFTVYRMCSGLMADLEIKVPVVLHLDHESEYEVIKEAIDNGFTSVMYDGSGIPLSEQKKTIKKILSYIGLKNKKVSLEVEIDKLGGIEDSKGGSKYSGSLSTVERCKEVSQLPVTSLAVSINNVHGRYPDDWAGLNLNLLKTISQSIDLPLVLHGGSGVSYDQIKESIGLGIRKMNVSTELQLAFSSALREYIMLNKDLKGKGYSPGNIFNFCFKEVAKEIERSIKMAGSEDVFRNWSRR